MAARGGRHYDLIRDIAREPEAQKTTETNGLAEAPRYALTVVEAFDMAMEALGRLGKEALYSHLEQQFELRRTDIAMKPWGYLSAMRLLLGNDSTAAIEQLTISVILEKEGVKGFSLEETIDALKKKYESKPSTS